MNDVVLRRFDSPDEVRVFDKGRLEIVRIGSLVLGRASYEPGWKSSGRCYHDAPFPREVPCAESSPAPPPGRGC